MTGGSNPTPLVGETVSFSIGGAAVGTATTDSNGIATFPTTDSIASMDLGAGTYTGFVSASYAPTSGKYLGTTATEDLVVNPAPLTVTAAGGESMTYGDSVPVLPYGYTGLVNNDTRASFEGSLSTTATSSSSVGSYPINQGSLQATGNYTIGTFNPATLTVNQAPLTVKANKATMPYGQTTPPTLTASYSGFLNGDTASVVTGSPDLSTTATLNQRDWELSDHRGR